MRNYVKTLCAVLMISGVLFLAGCPDASNENTVLPGLVGNWSNELSGNDLKTFSIKPNGSFSVTLNPAGGDGEGEVKGILIKEGREYKMNKMKETTGKDWGGAVRLYNGTYVQIALTENNTVFELHCAGDNAVEQFFGGIYHRQ